MTASRWKAILGTVLLAAVAAIAFVFVQVDIATKSIQFDLKIIGQSVYEARSRSGKWPTQISDLEGTSYLNMPFRREALERHTYIIIWPENLDPDPKVNAGRILAYDNGGLLAWLGRVWACRGDLSIDRLSAQELATLNPEPAASR